MKFDDMELDETRANCQISEVAKHIENRTRRRSSRDGSMLCTGIES